MSAWRSAIEVELVTPDEEVFAGDLTGVRGREVELTFDTDGPRIGLAARVCLRFRGAGLSRELQAAARPLLREEEAGERRYRLLLQGEIEEELKACLRRRDAFRVAPDARERVRVAVQALDAAEPIAVEAELADISLLGLSLRVHPSDEARLADVGRVRLALHLPGEEGTLRVDGALVRRAMTAGAAQLGVELSPASDESAQDVEERLTRYVVRRQMEELGGESASA